MYICTHTCIYRKVHKSYLYSLMNFHKLNTPMCVSSTRTQKRRIATKSPTYSPFPLTILQGYPAILNHNA